MKLTKILFFFFLFLFIISTSNATTQISNPEDLKGIGRYNFWLKNSKVPTPNFSIRVIEKQVGKYSKYKAFPKHKKIVVEDWGYLWEPEYNDGEHREFYQRDRDDIKTLFMHEIGHIWDLAQGQSISRKYREKFLNIMKFKTSNSWNCNIKGCERFAVAYSHCAFWPKKLAPYSNTDQHINAYGYFPSLKQHKKVCKLIRNAR